MGDWFVGEIRLFPYGVVPDGWAQCKGQTIEVSQNPKLYAAIGNQFGGMPQQTFLLPNLSGRVIAGTGGTNLPGEVGMVGGSDTVTLTTNQIPSHTHQAMAVNNAGAGPRAGGKYPSAAGASSTSGAPPPPNLFAPASAGPIVQLNAFEIADSGGDRPHENRQPYLALNYCIALVGQFPPHQ